MAQELEMTTLYIRADANSSIASGHIRRCVTIADRVPTDQMQVVFVCSDQDSRDFLSSISDYECVVLDTRYDHPEDEKTFWEALKESGHLPDIMLIDSYFVTEEYLLYLKSIGIKKLAYIDDLYSFDYPVDMVINYDPIVDDHFYKSAKVKLTGPGYAPLREQFAGPAPKVRERADHLLITTGATDHYREAVLLLDKITSMEDAAFKTITVVIGNLYDASEKRDIEVLASHHPEIDLVENVQNMAELMAECDIAVTAGGTTVYELCSMRRAIVAFAMAENQEKFLAEFDKTSSVIYAGSIHSEQEAIALADTIADKVLFLRYEYEQRQKMSETAHALIDGKGAAKIAQQLVHAL